MQLSPETSPQTAEQPRALLSFVPNDEIVRKEQEAEQKRREQEAQNQPVVLSLAAHIKKCWQAARSSKEQTVEPLLLKCLRLRKGEYDAETLGRIKKYNGTDLFVNLTNVKCRAAQTWLKDVLLPPGEVPWSIEPTPIPELPAEIETQVKRRVFMEYQNAMLMAMQLGEPPPDESQMLEHADRLKSDVLTGLREEAEASAEQVKREINDDLVEGGWYESLEQITYDVTTFPSVFMKGPVIRKTKKLVWEQEGTAPAVIEAFQRQYDRVSPFNIYPAPGAKSIQDDYLIEKHRLSRTALNNLIGVPGYSESAIRLVLQEHGRGGLRDWLSIDTERSELEDKANERLYSEAIDALQFWGPIQGSMLLEWGMSRDEVEDADIDYHVSAWLIGNIVISAKLNPHPLGKRPYYSTSFEPKNDSVWGTCPPLLMEDTQRICNACARAIVNNMGMASGPQAWMLSDQLQPGQGTDMFPWKLWQFKTENMMNGSPPMGFFQPNSNVDALLKIYDYYFKQASEVTGIPAYVYGAASITGGAARTASGLSMLMNMASKNLKAVAGNVDTGIIKPSIEEHWLHLMLHEPEKARGDIKILARASEYLIMLEQLQIRRSEFLNATNNPTDIQIIGLEGRAEILRENARALKMNTSRIVPDKDDLTQKKQQLQMQLYMQNLSQTLGVAPEELMRMAVTGNKGGGNGGQQQPRQLNEAGEPAGGQEYALQ